MTEGSPQSNSAASPSVYSNHTARNSSLSESTFSNGHTSAKSKLDLEPNPFEQSFASKEGTPNSTQKALLPPVASLASPSSLLGSASNTGFNWGINSLRSGPLSPAMLQGPAQSAALASFVDSHLRGGLTPNESGIRTALTPGGSGSIFPAPSPTTAAIFGLVPPTPSGLQSSSFPQTPQPVEPPASSQAPMSMSLTSSLPASATTSSTIVPATSAPTNHPSSPVFQPQIISQSAMAAHEQSGQSKMEPYADSANAAANGLYLLSQGQQQAEASKAADERRPSNDGKADKKKTAGSAGGRKNSRKAEESVPASHKRQKPSATQVQARSESMSMSPPKMEDEPLETADSKKMTDEEKRKNFLERNRVAALKCRQRKKQWLANLQAKVEYYGNENDALNAQVTALREQVVNLKALLLAHKDCSASRALPPGQDPINVALGQDFVGNIGVPQQHGVTGLPPMGTGMANANVSARRYA
ncbi:Aft1 HRA domain-containing protein [Lipomyces kononenkoae]|uniref:Aft1 HRA domain-containing protein n=1 Tax=Lipomyces kononenkoae TaxID=34357 RepID=A0ACC3SSB3_LIPKO